MILSIRSKRRKKPLAYLTGIARGSADTAYDALDRLDVEAGRRAGRSGPTPAQRCDANSNRSRQNFRLHSTCKKDWILDVEWMLRVEDRTGRVIVNVTSIVRIVAQLRQGVSGILCAPDKGRPYDVTTRGAEETTRTEPRGALSWASKQGFRTAGQAWKRLMQDYIFLDCLRPEGPTTSAKLTGRYGFPLATSTSSGTTKARLVSLVAPPSVGLGPACETG